MRRGRAWKKRARRTATASLPLWARIPRFYIWNNELEHAKDAICERPLNLYVCRRGALWLAYHRTQTQSATQWEFLFNPSTDIDSYYSYDTRTLQKCFIRTGYSFQPSIRLNSNKYTHIYTYITIHTHTLTEQNYKRNTFVFARIFMSWTQRSKTFLCTQKAYFSQTFFTNLSKSVLVSTSLPRQSIHHTGVAYQDAD